MIEPKGPVFWYQGLFLQPQHFQQADLHTESLLEPFRNYILPYFWGACATDADEGSLKDMVFDLKSGEFIFQDGTRVVLNKNGKVQPRSFRDLWGQSRDPFLVYLALRRWNLNGANLHEPQEGDGSSAGFDNRFITKDTSSETLDLYREGRGAHIATLDYALKFIWDSEIEHYSDHYLIPIARIEFNGQDAFISQDFVPPAVTLSSSPVLVRYFKNIKELLFSRCLILGEYKNPSGFLANEFQSSYFNFLLALRTINRYIPVINHLSGVSHIHPWSFYGILTQFIGEMSSFTDRIDALGHTETGENLLPVYDHTNLAHCFKQAYLLIDEILDSLLRGMESVIHLIRADDYFSAMMPANLLASSNTFYVGIKTAMDKEKLLNAVRHILKMSCQEDMPVLVKRSLPGLPLEYVPEPPPGLPRRADVLYFGIDNSNKYWQPIQNNANLCVFWGNAPADAGIDLIILKQ